MDRLTFANWFKREYPLHHRVDGDTSLKAALRIAWETAESQALSQEAVRDEVLEEAAKACESERIVEDGDAPRRVKNYEKAWECARAIRALKREPNAAGQALPEGQREVLGATSGGNQGPAPVAPVAETVKRLKDRGRELFGSTLTAETVALLKSLERRLSLAQTEIKGHMRVEDELKARIAELEKDRDSWKREAEMIGNAWQRELCDQGILYRHKTHWIDFMVLATRQVMALAKENGVVCCNQPELCAKTDCNKLLRYRLAALKSRA